MLYILLIIIAIGVLLASTEGKEFLNYLIVLLAIGGLLYLGFWVVIISIGLFSSESFKETVVPILGGIMIAGYAGYGIYITYKGFKKGDYTIKKLLPYIKGTALACLILAILWIGAYYLSGALL